jgi:hypothetical protein
MDERDGASELGSLAHIRRVSIAASNRVPSLMIHGPGCALPQNARTVYDRWAGPKQLEWLEGQQIDFYDQPEHVEPSVKAIDEWFQTHLGGSGPAAAS